MQLTPSSPLWLCGRRSHVYCEQTPHSLRSGSGQRGDRRSPGRGVSPRANATRSLREIAVVAMPSVRHTTPSFSFTADSRAPLPLRKTRNLAFHMSKKRRQHSTQFKAQVGLEILKGIEPVHAIAAKHAIHPVQVSEWKRRQAALESIRGQTRRRCGGESARAGAVRADRRMELEWLKKAGELQR